MNSHWQYLEEQPGHFVTLDGKVMGKHRGRHFNPYLSVSKMQCSYLISTLVYMTLCLCCLVPACVCVLLPGHHFFTIGQRARLEGMANPWFVAAKDPKSNTITVVY